MKLMRRVALLSMTLFSLLLMAEQKDPPSDRELAGVTSHGRMMAEYDIAAWHATDAVRAVVQPGSEVKHAFYIARKGERGWTVVFGQLNEKQDKYVIFCEAVQGATPTLFDVKKYDPPREDSDFYLISGRALKTAMSDFERPNRHYNTYVLPAENGRFYVYLLPASTVDGLYPLGTDVRYLFSSDGARFARNTRCTKLFLSPTSEKRTKI